MLVMVRPRYTFPRWFFPVMAAGIVLMIVASYFFFVRDGQYVLAAITWGCAVGATVTGVRFWRRSDQRF